MSAASVLEPAAQAFAEATAEPPFLFDLPLVEGRAVVEEVHSGDFAQPEVDERWIRACCPVAIAQTAGFMWEALA